MLHPRDLLKAQGIVVVLVGVAVGLFVLLYALMANQPATTRLFTALCVPPLVLGVLVGAFVLVRGNFKPPASS